MVVGCVGSERVKGREKRGERGGGRLKRRKGKVKKVRKDRKTGGRKGGRERFRGSWETRIIFTHRRTQIKKRKKGEGRRENCSPTTHFIYKKDEQLLWGLISRVVTELPSSPVAPLPLSLLCMHTSQPHEYTHSVTVSSFCNEEYRVQDNYCHRQIKIKREKECWTKELFRLYHSVPLQNPILFD